MTVQYPVLQFRPICHIPLGITGDSPNPIIGTWNNLKRIQTLRSTIGNSKPDAVISFMETTNVITLLATRGLNMPVLVSERIDPAKRTVGRIWENCANGLIHLQIESLFKLRG